MNTIARCLVAGLLALITRALLDGLTFVGGLAGAVLVVLLLIRLVWFRSAVRTSPADRES